MIQESTIEAAAQQARDLISSGNLPHIDRRARFTVRRSTRRETSLLQEFLTRKTQDQMSTYLQEDVESLVARRRNLMMAFFIALYLDPASLKKSFGSGGSRAAELPTEGASDTGGTGGVDMAAAIDTPEQEEVDSAGKSEGATMEASNDIIGEESHISALNDIVSTGSQSISDEEIEIFG